MTDPIRIERDGACITISRALYDEVQAAIAASTATKQYRVAMKDEGDRVLDYGDPEDTLEAAEWYMNEVCRSFKPPYDEVWIEERPVGEWRRRV